MGDQRLLQIDGIDVDAAGGDHVLLAADQREEAVLVHDRHVARADVTQTLLFWFELAEAPNSRFSERR
jgi:hypothetical protein